MKHQEKPPRPVSPANRLREKDLSRRKFLQSAGVAGMAAMAIPIAGIAQSVPEVNPTSTEDRMDQVLSRYGSEFGDLTQIR